MVATPSGNHAEVHRWLVTHAHSWRDGIAPNPLGRSAYDLRKPQ